MSMCLAKEIKVHDDFRRRFPLTNLIKYEGVAKFKLYLNYILITLQNKKSLPLISRDFLSRVSLYSDRKIG